MENLKLFGTTHLMSKEEIINIIKLENPDIIGVELCNTRLNALVINPIIQENKEDNSLIGKISNAIRKKAEEEKLEYGSDMITASKYALDNKIHLVLVDRDITEIRELMNKIPQEEVTGFMNELVKFESQTLDENTKNLNEQEVLNELKTKYPISYEFLITSRELYITNKILKIIIKYPKKKILIFLGVGHLNSINKLLES